MYPQVQCHHRGDLPILYGVDRRTGIVRKGLPSSGGIVLPALSAGESMPLIPKTEMRQRSHGTALLLTLAISGCSASGELRHEARAAHEERHVPVFRRRGPTCPSDMIDENGVCWACPLENWQDCQRRCEDGSPGACTILAMEAQIGFRMPEADERLAQVYYRRACDGGAGRACVEVAKCHFKGKYCPKDPARAREILRTWCEAGTGRACVAYGQVKIEDGEAAAGFSYAERGCVELGDPAACLSLRKLCSEYPAHAPTDCVDVAREHACRAGDKEACAGDLGEGWIRLPISH